MADKNGMELDTSFHGLKSLLDGDLRCHRFRLQVPLSLAVSMNFLGMVHARQGLPEAA